jgi:hypothetical protein
MNYDKWYDIYAGKSVPLLWSYMEAGINRKGENSRYNLLLKNLFI